MLAPPRRDSFIGPKANIIRFGDSKAWPHNAFSPLSSAVSKTKQHNDFLSLFARSQVQPLAFAHTPSPSHTKVLSSTLDQMSMTAGKTSGAEAVLGHKSATQSLDTTPLETLGTKAGNETRLTRADELQNTADTQVPVPFSQDDPHMAKLISQMNEYAIIKDTAVKDAKTLQIPKGYLMDCETTPSDFYKNREEVGTHVKRKRQEGVLSRQKGRKERHGFRPQEVNWTGAVSLPNCKASDLTNEIHPLLGRSRFDDTPDAIYDQLMPALRLATMFLTQPVCMQFWTTMATAQRRDDLEMTLKYGKRCQRIDKHVQMTQENTADIIGHLEELGNANIIHFVFKHKLLQNTAWGFTAPICDHHGLKKTPLTRSYIQLHSDVYVAAKKLSQLRYREISQQLRFNFFFATLIMHELAHSIEGAYVKMRYDQWAEYKRTRQYMEPFWLDWHRPPECGKAWEECMFGGEIQPINRRVDGTHGMGTTDWPPRGSDADSERRIWYTVPMAYIEKLFQMSTWQRRYKLTDWRVFHIPRIGATSLYINSFTTMSWSEERRAAEEDLAELLAIENAQPATKKRMVSSGEGEEKRLDDPGVINQAIMGKMQPDVQKRQASRILNTQRLSSVMPEPPPTARIMGKFKSDEPLRVASHISNGLPYHQSKIRCVEGSKSQVTVQPRHKPSTFELIQRSPRKPNGLLDVYKRRRKLDTPIERAEATGKRERRILKHNRERNRLQLEQTKTAGERGKLAAAENTTASA